MSDDPLAPRWTGRPGRFEIWFLVAFFHGPRSASRRAFWLRHTLFAPGDGGPARATVWAALFDASLTPTRTAGKRIAPLGPGAVAWPLDFAGCRLDRDGADGELSVDGVPLAWSLRFPAVTGAAPRLPHLPEAVPAPTRAWHLASEHPIVGRLRLGDRELTLDGTATMMHLEGTRRVDELAWCYAPRADGDGAPLELTWVRPRVGLPGLWGAHVAGRQTGGMLGARVSQPATGVLRAVLRGGGRTLVARAWARPADLVGYVYRDPAGHDLHVAQSDLATVVVDVYDRGGTRRARSVSRGGAAVEFHQREPLPGVPYVGWDETALPSPSAAPAPVARRGQGTWLPLPAPRAVAALGLTYADHLRETGHDPRRPPPPVVFAKDPRAWLPDGDEVTEPDGRALRDALAPLAPEVLADLDARLPSLPALLDWEGELALVVVDDLDDARLDGDGALPAGLCAAVDLTARSVQILGDGSARELELWAASKSFTGFLPIVPEVWLPPGGLDARWPDLTVELWVNGARKQQGHTRDLLVSPRQALRLARRHLDRPLVRGDVVLTGTPSGVALQVPRWKRRLAGLLLSRVGRLAVAARGALRGQFLEPGDEVTVDAGPAGRRTVRIGV